MASIPFLIRFSIDQLYNSDQDLPDIFELFMKLKITLSDKRDFK